MKAARCVCWGFDLGEDRGFEILWDHYNPRCVPPWGEAELRKKCRDAMDPAKAREPRGWLRDAADDSRPVNPGRFGAPADFFAARAADHWPADAPTPSTPALPPEGQGSGPPKPPEPDCAIGVEDDDPHRLARLYLRRFDHPDGLTLRYWGGDFACWRDGAYDLLSDDEVRNELTRVVEREFHRLHAERVRMFRINSEKGDEKAKPPRKSRVTRNLVSDVLQALKSECGLPSSLNPPAWLDCGPPAGELVAARNGVIHLPSLVAEKDCFTPSTPRFFTFNRIDYDFDPDAPKPERWLAFLDQLWPGDPQSIACLQEWFGYLLTSDTSLQKMLLILGPTRGGKGTISKVLTALLGEKNIAAPTLGNLAERFGLQDLIGKPLAMFADARLSGRADAVAVTEQILSITGEDKRTVDRKNRPPLTLTLNTRFVFLSNEMPALGDASGALLGRFVILRLTESFLGREDRGLLDKLLPHLPGILLWAVEGWSRLHAAGRFTIADSSAELTEEAEAVVSPLRTFIAQRVELAEGEFCSTRALYAAWVEWCKNNGLERIDHLARFVIKLRAALPNMRSTRARAGGTRIPGYSGIRLLSDYEAGGIDL